MKTAAAAAAGSLALANVTSGQLVWPSKWDELEDYWTMLSGYGRHGFSDAVTPCTFGRNLKSTQSSAEWIRTAFHDMATSNAETGEGGIDASIFLETDRPENPGEAFSGSAGFFSGFQTIRTSMADLIALGVTVASGACDGPKVAVRGGRIDADKPGPAGVPEPSTDFETTLKTFEKAGFSQQDMIAMVACGHTLGGVHSVDFPDLVEIPADSNNDTTVPFQENIASINNGVVTEYLDGTTKNPLVVAQNDTLNSDKRIFDSDREYMKKLADKDTFNSVCGDIFTRMIETVPKGVELTDVIQPYEVKPYINNLYVNEDGDFEFSGYIRLRTSQETKRDYADISVNLIYADRNGNGRNVITTRPATYQGGFSGGLHGETFFSFEFDTTINAQKGISKFWIEETTISTNKTRTHDNQGSGGYPVKDIVVLQPSQSCRSYADGKFTVVIVVNAREQYATSPLVAEIADKITRENISFAKFEKTKMDLKPTGETKNGWVTYQLKASFVDPSSFDIFLGDDEQPALEYQKIGGLPRTCPT